METKSLVTMFQEWVWSWLEERIQDAIDAKAAKFINEDWNREAHAARMAEMEVDIETVQRELRSVELDLMDEGAVRDCVIDIIRNEVTVSIDL